MWTGWSPWSFWHGRDEKKKEAKKQQNMAERRRQPRGVGYYQRDKTEELSTKPSETAATDKGKVKFLDLEERVVPRFVNSWKYSYFQQQVGMKRWSNSLESF